MHFLRKLSLGLTASILVTVLSTFGILFAVYHVLSTPTNIKGALLQSGIYQTVVGNALDQAQKEQGTTANQDIPINDPAVRSVLQQAASPAFLQNQSENALDALYSWLGGKSDKLNIRVELGEAKTRLAEGMGQYAQQRLATLPTCGQGVSADDFNPFSATCAPAGVDGTQLSNQVKDKIANGEFLKDGTTLTSDSIKTKDGKSLEQQLKAAPVAYKWSKWAVYGLGLLAVLLVAGVILLSPTRRQGLKKIATIFATTGLTTALLAWASSFGLKIAAEQLAKVPGGIQPLQQTIFSVAQLLVNDIRVWWLGYGLLLLVIGLSVLLTLHLTKPKVLAGAKSSQPVTPPQTTEPAAAPAPKPAPLPNTKPKPRPVKKLVQ